MYLEKTLEVTKSELILETDYLYGMGKNSDQILNDPLIDSLEAHAQIRMKELLRPFSSYYVPSVYTDFSSREVLASEFVMGASLDQIVDYDVEVCWVVDMLFVIF
jgi:hypothetical protein